MVLLSALTGAVTGAIVALFEWVTSERLFGWVLSWPVWLQAFAPLCGLVLSAGALRWLSGGSSPSTADEYIRNFHDRNGRLAQRPLAGRIVASLATLGFGGALGFEGPSIYMGSAVGSAIQHRLSHRFPRRDAKLLLVAGAAAGVAAIFKAPATGVVFALEVPYQDDLARRMLVPALSAAAASYVVFAALRGTLPLLPVGGAPPFDLRDLGGAAVVGVLGGLGARGFSRMLRWAKRLAARSNPWVRALVASVLLAGLFAVSSVLTGQGLTLGSGYRTVAWSTDPRHGILIVVAIFVVRGLATIVTIAGGGVGGLFIPLAIQGALLGRVVGDVLGASTTSLFPLIGVAAFLGAGYRVPLAAVMFVAESTGRPGFVVPGLIAAAIAQLAMGASSVSPYQVASRAGHLERRFSLPISAALQTDIPTASPDATIAEFFTNHLLGTRQRSVPVVEGLTYRGMARMQDLERVPRDQWDTTPMRAIIRNDGPTGRLGWLLRDAIRAMQANDTDHLPVVDPFGHLVGIVTTRDILNLDEILEQAEDQWP